MQHRRTTPGAGLVLSVALLVAAWRSAQAARDYGYWAPGRWQYLHTSSDSAPEEQFETDIAGEVLYGRFVSRDDEVYGVTLLFLHDETTSVLKWKQLGILDYFQDNDVHAVAMDLPGTGKSDGIRGSIGEADSPAEFLSEMIDYAGDGKPVIVVTPSESMNYAIPLLLKNHSRNTPIAGWAVVSPPSNSSLGLLQGIRSDLQVLAFLGGSNETQLVNLDLLHSTFPNIREVVIEGAGREAFMEHPQTLAHELHDMVKRVSYNLQLGSWCVREQHAATAGKGCEFVCPQGSCKKPSSKCLEDLEDCECIPGLEMSSMFGTCVPTGMLAKEEIVGRFSSSESQPLGDVTSDEQEASADEGPGAEEEEMGVEATTDMEVPLNQGVSIMSDPSHEGSAMPKEDAVHDDLAATFENGEAVGEMLAFELEESDEVDGLEVEDSIEDDGSVQKDVAAENNASGNERVAVSDVPVDVPVENEIVFDVSEEEEVEECERVQLVPPPGRVCNFVCPEGSCMIRHRVCLDHIDDCRCHPGMTMSQGACVLDGADAWLNNKQLVPEDECERVQAVPPPGRLDCTFVCPEGSCKKPSRRCLNELSDCECQIPGTLMSDVLGTCIQVVEDSSDSSDASKFVFEENLVIHAKP